MRHKKYAEVNHLSESQVASSEEEEIYLIDERVMTDQITNQVLWGIKEATVAFPKGILPSLVLEETAGKVDKILKSYNEGLEVWKQGEYCTSDEEYDSDNYSEGPTAFLETIYGIINIIEKQCRDPALRKRVIYRARNLCNRIAQHQIIKHKSKESERKKQELLTASC